MKSLKSPVVSFTNGFAETLVELAETDKNIVAITAAMPSGTGFVKIHEGISRQII